MRLYDEIRAAGFAGSYSLVKQYVRKCRPNKAPDPVVRFETPAGFQAQVDFAEFRLPCGKRYALLVVLGYSRVLWVQFYPRQTLAVLMRGLEDDADLNEQARSWTTSKANERLHRTTDEVPNVRFERDERAALQALAHRPYRSVLALQRPSKPSAQLPVLPKVQRRPLAAYARLTTLR